MNRGDPVWLVRQPGDDPIAAVVVAVDDVLGTVDAAPIVPDVAHSCVIGDPLDSRASYYVTPRESAQNQQR